MMEYDQPLVWVTLLMLFGMVMVYSASIALPDSPKFAYLGRQEQYFLLRQGLFIGISIVAAACSPSASRSRPGSAGAADVRRHPGAAGAGAGAGRRRGRSTARGAGCR
jgi:hypothetical protein